MRNQTLSSSNRSNRRRPIGFTLLEMLISVALVLVLMLAVTRIFTITGAAVGASQGFSAATRDARAAQAVFAHDIGSMASDSPFVWIRYDPPVPAFRNKTDEQNDRDYSGTPLNAGGMNSAAQRNAMRTIDIDANGSEGEASVIGEQTDVPNQFVVDGRNHRQDGFSFCARDRFYRQTGNTNLITTNSDDVLVSNMSSAEAWITYEHLVLPHTDGVFALIGDSTNSNKTNPGAGSIVSNPQNFYANQWILGRVQMLMVLPTGAPSGNSTDTQEYVVDNAGIHQELIKKTNSWISGSTLEPFSSNNNRARDGMGAVVTHGGSNVLIQDARYDLVGVDIANSRKIFTDNITAAPATPWYANMLTSPFQVNPFVVKPINAYNAAQQVPVFIPACSQFIVEYAGDFITQNADGSIDDQGTVNNYGLMPDGQVDFNIVGGVRQIQWFGMPRSTSGNGVIGVAFGDVVTVGDFVHYLTGTFVGATSPYTNYGVMFARGFDGWERITSTRVPKDAYAAADAPFSFFAAWGPTDTNRPKLYRITLTIDRPEMAGRTNDGMPFEYVYSAP